MPINDLARATAEQREELDAALGRVMSSGWFVLGTEVQSFERELADYLGVAHAVGVGNGTDALRIALVALGCQRDDEVLTVANAGGYTTSAARALGLDVGYADVDPGDLLIDARSVEARLTERTRAVVVTHLYGAMADVAAIVALCTPRGITVVEDCAQAIGASCGGSMAGSIADVGTFSFYPTKNLGALGDGGALVTSDDALAVRIRALRQYGWSSKYTVGLDGGQNSRLDEMQAAILRARLPRVGADNKRRREIHAAYAAALPPAAGRFPHRPGSDFVAHLAVFVAADRDRARAVLTEHGVQTEVHYPIPDHRQQIGGAAVTLPATEMAAEHVVTVPCFPELTEDEIRQVCHGLAAI